MPVEVGRRGDWVKRVSPRLLNYDIDTCSFLHGRESSSLAKGSIMAV